MPFSEFDETRLHYELTGAGEPLFLVHGSWVDGGVWEAVVPLLASRFEVVTYDRRGHSRSSCPPGQGSIREDVEDLAALIDGLGMAPAHVAGASLGGSIVLRLAASHPALLRSIAVHEPPLFELIDAERDGFPEMAELRARLAAVAARLEAGDDEGAARQYHEQLAGPSDGWARLSPADRRMRVINAPTYLDQCLDPEALEIDLNSLEAFQGPALVTYGDLRPPLFRRIAQMVVAALPAAHEVEIPGTAHNPQVTHPDAYARVLTEFASTAAWAESGQA
jgi:pimeloyl-ACP methyl ester carboxylesterase